MNENIKIRSQEDNCGIISYIYLHKDVVAFMGWSAGDRIVVTTHGGRVSLEKSNTKMGNKLAASTKLYHALRWGKVGGIFKNIFPVFDVVGNKVIFTKPALPEASAYVPPKPLPVKEKKQDHTEFSKREDLNILNLRAFGTSFEQIAEKLDRPVDDVIARGKELKAKTLTRHSCKVVKYAETEDAMNALHNAGFTVTQIERGQRFLFGANDIEISAGELVRKASRLAPQYLRKAAS